MTRVMLEVGHGPYRDRTGATGFEEGASGPGTTEYKQVKQMAPIAAAQLRELGYEVEISDPVDTLVAIGQKAAGSDLFVSLHLNAFNRSAQGTEVLVHRNGTQEDVELAQYIQNSLVAALGLANRGVKRQGLAVLSGVPLTVRAACLTESYFIDAVPNAATAERYTELAGRAIAEGIDKYAAANGIKPQLAPINKSKEVMELELVNVAKYYSALPHQIAALNWLQDQLSPQVKEEFTRRWRNG